METNELWKKFEETLRRKARFEYDSLQAPATSHQIEAAEAAMDVTFPAPLREAYLRHDGVKQPPGGKPWCKGLFPSMMAWCTLSEMVSTWQMMFELARGARADDHDGASFPERADWWDELAIYPGWWSPKWIPIGLSGTNSRLYVDMAPCVRGTVGQIIEDGGMQESILIAPGLNEWIEFVTRSLESGRFVAEPIYGGWTDTLYGPHNRRSYSYFGWNSSGAVGTGPPNPV